MERAEIAADMAAKWWGERLQAGDRAKFEEVLRSLVQDDLERCGWSYLECDYDPIGHLLLAVRAAGNECSGMLFSARGILPQKHELSVSLTELAPKEGYGNWTDAIPVPETI